jgi:hypothetical protein
MREQYAWYMAPDFSREHAASRGMSDSKFASQRRNALPSGIFHSHSGDRAFIELGAPMITSSTLTERAGRVHKVFGSGAPFEILKSVICAFAVLVIHLRPVLRRICKRLKSQPMDVYRFVGSIDPEGRYLVPVSAPRFQNLPCSSAHRFLDSADLTSVRDLINAFEPEGRFPVFHRGTIARDSARHG